MKTDIGLGIKAPEKECGDRMCAWHGKASIRGKVFRGTVKTAKAHNTVIVSWGYHRYIKKYERYERRNSSVAAHNPPCLRVKEGDKVVIAECRPISKSKNFIVVGKE